MPSDYRFGRFELQPQERRLLAGGLPVVLGARAFDVLLILVQRRGGLVSKTELIERVWAGLVVEENNLQVQVSALRRVLGTEAIATVSGHGYRFTLELSGDEPPSVPAAASIASHNLPQALTSFVGRTEEFAEIGKRLASSRLLTLVGAAGCGKSRLAVEVARGLVDRHPDGVWLVDLAQAGEPSAVAASAARVLGVEGRPDISLLHAIGSHLHSRRALLVVDNADHVLEDCAALVDAVLRQSTHVVVLATSREPLRLAGETIFRVPQLSLPRPDRDLDPAAVSASESARLLVDRARLQQPRFAVTEENAQAVANVCRRLDGIPLAIELATARLQSMTIQEINAKLDQRFGLLTAGSRTALPRQRTLRSTIDWSYDRLTHDERVLFCRLSVFAGGWLLEAAEQVCAGDGIDARDVAGLLDALVDKSLVTIEQGSTATRYGFLETLHDYSVEHQRERTDTDALHLRHLNHYLAVAEAAAAGSDDGSGRLAAERENVAAAIAWARTLQGQGAADGPRLAAGELVLAGMS